MDFDAILVKCGNNHRYQFMLLALFAFLMIITAMHNFSQNVISFVPDHWCYHEKLQNHSFEELENIYNIFEKPSCTNLDLIDELEGNYTIKEEKCESWIYNYDYGYKSMNTELNWVCDDAYKAPVGQSFFFVGSMCGTLIFGILGDKIGRIKALIMANLCGFLGDFSTIFAKNLTVFSATRFISGLAIDANSYLFFILLVEYISPKMRSSFLGISMSMGYGVGMVCASLLAVFVGHWQKFLMCSSFPLLLVIGYYFVVQESAQWLVTRNDIDGAIRRLQNVAKFNGKSLSNDDIDAIRYHYEKSRNSNDQKDTFSDLLKKPHLRMTFLKMLTVFMIIMIAFNLMSRSVEGLGISPFIMFALNAMVVQPVGFVQAFIQTHLGRKGSSISAMILTALFTAICGILQSIYQKSSVILMVSLTLVTRFGVSLCYGATFLFSTELIPTSVRSRGLAVAHIAGAAASLFSPYIMLLGNYYKAAPNFILSVMFIICSAVCVMLPETTNRNLPINLEEGEVFGKGDGIFDFLRQSRKEDKPKTEKEAIS